MLTAKEYFDICHKMGCRVPDTVYNADADEQDEWGSPPPMRGKVCRYRSDWHVPRITPAHAGSG